MDPLSPKCSIGHLGRFVDSIDMPDVTFHALRHTHVSQLIDAGVDIATISKRLGHAKPDITLRVYAHLVRNDDSKAAAAIDAAFAGPRKGVTGPSLQQGRISKWHRALLKRLGMLKSNAMRRRPPEARQEVIASQIADALLGIQWMLVSIADSMNRMERNK
jgi:Phage integrase family